MRRIGSSACALLLVAAGCGGPPSREAPERVVAFTHASVVPMDRDQLLSDQTVLVRGETITQLGSSASVPIPDGALRIDARGKYLLPGLADMHVHVQSESELLLAIAHGVTTIRDLFGAPYKVIWRDRIARGELLGPTLIAAGPIVDGDPPDMAEMTRVVDPADAERVVAEQQRRGYDVLKLYHNLSPPAYHALIAAARRRGLPVAGHVPPTVGLHAALRAGQNCIEHLDGYVFALQPPAPLERAPALDPDSSNERFLAAIPTVDERRIPKLAANTREAAVWNCPTLVAYRDWGLTPTEANARFAQPEVSWVHPLLRAQWAPANQATIPSSDQLASQTEARLMKRCLTVHQKLTKALVDVGAGVLLGTDAGVPFVVPGYGALEELGLMVDAGLTPYQALRTATTGPAEFLGVPGRFGTIRAGARADLILLHDDPLRDVGALKRRAGVMLRGRWLSQAELQQRLAQMLSSYDAPPQWFAGMPDSSSAERWDRQLRFEVSSLGVVKGEERIFVRRDEQGSFVVASQHSGIEPKEQFSVRYESRNSRTQLQIESAGREGRGSLTLTLDEEHLQAKGQLPVVGEVDLTTAPRAGELLVAPGIVSSLWLYPHLAQLTVGASVEIPFRSWDYGPAYELSARSWKVTRAADAITLGQAVRVFEIEARGETALGMSRLAVDRSGLPVQLTIGSGEGGTSYSRLAPSR
jgi:imidazolonepropionase-like amidohydrolase